MNIQELAKKHTFEVLETLKIAEEIFKKKNLTPTTDVSFSEERAIEVAITEYRKNTPKIGKLRKKSDKKIPETIKPKLQPSTSFNLEKTTLKEVEETKPITETKTIQTAETTGKKTSGEKTSPETPRFSNKQTTAKKENINEETDFVKKDKQKKERQEKEKPSTKANYLARIEEETDLSDLEINPENNPENSPENSPETNPETIPETNPETIPETNPETIPETNPETNPETIPKTNPENKTTLNQKPTFSPHNKKKEFRKKKKHIINPRKKEIYITSALTAAQLASVIGKKIKEIAKVLNQLNQEIDKDALIEPDTAQLIAEELGIKLILKTKSVTDLLVQEETAENSQTRPPVVTIMGHVDHGKTSLLDCIRNSNIAVKEKGNITQHIGAYSVKVSDNTITFLDTPGHEAFSAMRARGSNITDIVILVVAVDDGIKPQTIEAIHHAQAAQTTIIVAITKCDKPHSNPKKIMEDLMQYNLIAEEYGGNITMLPVSSQTKEGINELLELIVIQASNMDLKANFDSRAKGVVIESKVDKNKGNLVSLLVQNGSLKTGDYILVGKHHGKIRTINDENNQKIKLVTPSMPAEVMGLSQIPSAGTSFQVTDEKIAKIVAEKIAFDEQQKSMQKTTPSEEDFFEQQKEVKELILLLKTDVQGSIEAVQYLVEKIKNKQVQSKIILTGVGSINLSDVNLAISTKAVILGFNVRAENSAQKLAESEKIHIQTFDVIYELLDSVKAMLSGMLTPIIREILQGQAEVLETFYIKKIGQIAGCQVNSGKITKDSILKIIRDNVVIHQNKLTSLKSFKNEAKVVEEGNECGLSIQGYKNFKAGDIVECYQQTETQVEL